MSTIPAKKIERNRLIPRSEIACAPPANRTYRGEELRCLAFGRRHMRVKLCARCPYAPRASVSHYDPEAALHACANCDGVQGTPAKHFVRKAHRRRKCATFPNIFGSAQRSAVRSVTESLVLSGTTPAEPPSVQRSALIASRPSRRATADGYADLKSPDKQLQNQEGQLEPFVSSLMPASVEESI
jgi:hypothetical protein